jgi:hypothetical protein
MKPKTQLAAQVIAKLFNDPEAYTEQQANEVAFHLTDWIEDLVPFVQFLEDPDKFDDERAMEIIFAFVAHAPYHLNLAAEIILDPEAKTNGSQKTS